jgi:hypothetical protein
MGGLGNYLFQIGATVTHANKQNTDYLFDFDSALQVHTNITKYSNNILRNIPTIKTSDDVNKFKQLSGWQEPNFEYNEIPQHSDLYLKGYYQTEKYLDYDLIHSLFKIDRDTEKYLHQKYNLITLKETVSVHVRRGNYVTKTNRHPLCSLEYYKKAMSMFSDVTFIVFSDDIQWCKENFKDGNFIFVEDEQDYVDLWFMSLCNHNIIANSTFSWWGAYLNNNKHKTVIAPSTWFGQDLKLSTKDLIPATWIKI